MSDVVALPIALDSDMGRDLTVDCARFAEGILTEAQVRKKYRFTNANWEALAENEALVEAIELEKTRRIRDGSAKREKAQMLVVKAPDVVAKIMNDDSANARHRIDSAKALNEFASNGPGQSAPASDRFVIQINLGDETLTFNKSIRPIEPGEIDPYDSGSDADIDAIAAIAKKETEGGSGEPI